MYSSWSQVSSSCQPVGANLSYSTFFLSHEFLDLQTIFKFSILLSFQIVYKLNFHTLCLSFVGFGSKQSMRYIYRDLVFHFLHGKVFDAFALGPHNMLAVMVIKSSMDQDGNWNKVVCKFRIWIILFWAGWWIGMYNNDISRSIKHTSIASGIAAIENEIECSH